MEVKDVANKWAEYCNTGQFDKAYAELYDQNCVSLEVEGAQGYPARTEGIEAILVKSKRWDDMVEEFHGMEIEGPIVAGNHFTATMKMDITMKGMSRRKDEEVAVFQVKDGKIVNEQFFYPIG
ncbi:MAG: SnoaL-like domain-containing protein [Flavobacteriales bacterium]